MSFETEQEQKLLRNFTLLCDLLSSNKAAAGRPKADLSKLEEIINKQIPDALSKNAPPDYYELYTDFQSEYEKLRDYILYDRLIGKCVVALGGGFSSGKSTFLNTLIGMDILPMEITPTTAVPTYMVNGAENSVEAINIFDVKVRFRDLSNIQDVSHDFGKIEEDGEVLAEGTSLGQILESIFVATPEQRFQNIAFLDTPGYSKADSEHYSARTDEQIARRQLNTANLILWFINSSSGDIVRNDIEFLRSLRPGIPIAVILTRAGQRESEIDRIKARVETSLAQNGLSANCCGVFACEREEPDNFDMPKVQALLEQWDRSAAEPDFAINFKRLFIRCKKYCEDELQKTRWELENLNVARLNLGQGATEDVERALDRLADEIRREQKALGEVLKQVKELQSAFFQELKNIGDRIGIRMPEPGDAELWREFAADPLFLLQEYNEKKGYKPDPRLRSVLRDTLGEISPTFNQFAGGSDYRQRLLNIIRDSWVPAEKVQLDNFSRRPIYQQLIRTLASGTQE